MADPNATSPVSGAAQAFAFVVVPFALAVMLAMNIIGGLPIFFEMGDSHGGGEHAAEPAAEAEH